VGNRNVLRWDCDAQGCFNKLLRPKIELFSEVLPGLNAFTDVDGLTMIGGRFLLVEWKSRYSEPPKWGGQGRALRELTKVAPVTVIMVVGDAETMDVRGWGKLVDGEWSGWTQIDLFRLREAIKEWGVKADQTVSSV